MRGKEWEKRIRINVMGDKGTGGWNRSKATGGRNGRKEKGGKGMVGFHPNPNPNPNRINEMGGKEWGKEQEERNSRKQWVERDWRKKNRRKERVERNGRKGRGGRNRRKVMG
jgi:hypothetical protein